MRWIKYQVVQCTVNGEIILANKKIGYSDENIIIARDEAYNGNYSIVEDETEFSHDPLSVELGGTGSRSVGDVIKNFGLQAKILYGTGEPTGGKDGDIYIQIVE